MKVVGWSLYVLKRAEWVGGSGFFEYVWGHCLPWALIGLHYVGHARCHLCFPSIVSCDHDSIPKENSHPKKTTTNDHCASPDSLWSVCFSKWEIIYVDILLTFNLYSMIPANKRSTQDIIKECKWSSNHNLLQSGDFF